MYFPLQGVPIKHNVIYGERSSPNIAGVFRLRKTEHNVWYCDDLHGWGKRFAAQPQTIYSEVP